MKRLVLSSTLFLIILTIGIINVCSLNSTISPIIETLEDAVSQTSLTSSVSQEKLELAFDEWNMISKRLALLHYKDDLDDIESSFVQVINLAKQDDEAYSIETECFELIHRLNHLISKEQLTLQNIF